MKQSAIRSNRRGRTASGFSLVESMIAIAVLAIGVLSLARLIPFSTRTDFGSRTDTTTSFIAMRELEQMLAQPWNLSGACGAIAAPCFTDAADGNGVSTTVGMNCTCAAAPCTGNAGAALTGAGTINFNQAQALVPAGFRRNYRIAQSTGNTVKINQGSYEMRWHVTCNVYSKDGAGNVVDGLFVYTVAARPTGNLPGMIPIPANVQAVRMK